MFISKNDYIQFRNDHTIYYCIFSGTICSYNNYFDLKKNTKSNSDVMNGFKIKRDNGYRLGIIDTQVEPYTPLL